MRIIEEQDKAKIIKIIKMFFPEAKIYLFGSYARGDYKQSSDIDIAIDIGKKIPQLEKNQIRHMLEVLNTLQSIDIVDFHATPPKMQENIRQEGIEWLVQN